MTNWERDFLNLNVDEKVCIFDKIILNILISYLMKH